MTWRVSAIEYPQVVRTANIVRESDEVISVTFAESAAFEKGEDECVRDDVAGSGGGAVESAQVAGEEGESAFAQIAHAAEQSVVGAVVHVEYLVTSGLSDRRAHADTSALVAGIGQYRSVERGHGPVQVTQETLTGSTSATHSGSPSGSMSACMLPPCSWACPEYHKSICFPLTLTVFSPQRSTEKIFQPRITHANSSISGLLQGFVRTGCLVGEYPGTTKLILLR